jgi:hypothetical protein
MAQSSQPPVKLNIGTAKEPPKLRGFMHDDFPIIRQACIRLGLCLAVATLLIGGTHFFYLQQKELQLQAQTELSQAQGKYTYAANEKNDIREFQPAYLQLVERGFVGEEKRLDVVELIQTIQAKYRLLPMSYEIFPQQIVALDPATPTGELELRASKLVFKMNLLHEMDMLNLFKSLRDRGQFINQSCAIKTSNAVSNIRLPNQLEAECSLQWVTMGRRLATDLAPAAPAQ